MFQAHLATLISLLMQFAEQEKLTRDLTPLCTYMVSASVLKIVLHMNQSTSFIEGLKDLLPFKYGQNEPPTKAPGTTIPDQDFCQVIPKLKAILGVDVLHLEVLVYDSQMPSFSYYMSEMYMEFHSVLVTAISSFCEALIQLKAFKLNPELEASLDEFEGCIADVTICGAILHLIAYGSAIEQHLQAISHLLLMHHQKHTISCKKVKVGKKEEEEDKEDKEEEEDRLSEHPTVHSCWAPETPCMGIIQKLAEANNIPFQGSVHCLTTC